MARPDVPAPHVASPEEIRDGQVTDVYFRRGEAVLKGEGENPQVVAEVRASTLPKDWGWGIFAGLEVDIRDAGGSLLDE